MMGQWGPRGTAEYGFMGPGMMGYVGMGPWMMGQGGSGLAICSAMAGHIEGRLAYIKTELAITQAQESLWDTYATAARNSGNIMLARCTTMMNQNNASTVSVPDRLDQNEQLLAAQLDAVRAMNKALKPLYGELTDSQKQRADQILLGPMGMM
jgi:LTXXQ motif family protein